MNEEPVAALKAVNLRVQDLGASLGFYRDGLGLPVVHEIEQIAVLDLGNVHLVLDAQDDPRSMGSGAVLHILVADVDAYHAVVCTRGITPENEPADRPWGDRDFVVIDPDGYKLTVVQARPEEVAEA
jgi:catechol 2,3-dioxygenase-like lactoylglutathione lyase family enzyme